MPVVYIKCPPCKGTGFTKNMGRLKICHSCQGTTQIRIPA